MATRWCVILVLVIAIVHATTRTAPRDASLDNQKNFVSYGGVGSYSGIGSNGLPFGGVGGVGINGGLSGGLGGIDASGLGEMGGLGGIVVGGIGNGSSVGVDSGVGSGSSGVLPNP